MNEAVVLDASIIVKWVVAEPGSDLAVALIEQHGGFCYAPGHALAEVFEVLVRKLRKGEVLPEQLDVATLTLPGAWISVEIGSLMLHPFDL